MLNNSFFEIDILQFDNSFSWVTSKSLHYIVEILPPDETVADDLGTKVKILHECINYHCEIRSNYTLI